MNDFRYSNLSYAPGQTSRAEAIRQRKGRPISVFVLGLRAAVGAQGGIEAHVRDLITAILHNHGSAVDFEVAERTPYVDAQRLMSPELNKVRFTSFWCPRSSHLEAITHSMISVLYAGFKRPDVVHIHGIGPACVAPLAKALGLRVVVTHHGEDYAREKWGAVARTVLKFGEFCAARFSDERIVIAPNLDAKLAARYGKDFRYIPNGIHPASPSGDPKVLERWNLVPGRYLMHVGRFVPEKRQVDLIEAFGRIDAPDWQLVLVGGSDHETAYSAQVKEAAARDPRIVLTGAIDRAEVADLFEHAAAFALPSSHEGLPIALLEALSHGLPVLISDLPNLVALDLPEECYVPVQDIDMLHARLEAVVQQVESAPEPVRIDWTRWLKTYSMETVAERTIDAYAHSVRR